MRARVPMPVSSRCHCYMPQSLTLCTSVSGFRVSSFIIHRLLSSHFACVAQYYFYALYACRRPLIAMRCFSVVVLLIFFFAFSTSISPRISFPNAVCSKMSSKRKKCVKLRAVPMYRVLNNCSLWQSPRSVIKDN